MLHEYFAGNDDGSRQAILMERKWISGGCQYAILSVLSSDDSSHAKLNDSLIEDFKLSLAL